MRYVVVNERIPKGAPRLCSFCNARVENGYVKALRDGLIYDTAMCLEAHRFATRSESGSREGQRLIPRLGKAS